MSEPYDGRQFVAGSVYGIRTFKVDQDGTLRSPVRDNFTWSAEENLAECNYRHYHNEYTIDPRTGRRKFIEHRPGMKDCHCGFYSYFSRHWDEYWQPGRVRAIIEGYGICSVGSRGFRSEKAKVVALVLPGGSKKSHWCKWAWRMQKMEFGAIMIGMVLAVSGPTWVSQLVLTKSPWFAPLYLLCGLGILMIAGAFHSISCDFKEVIHFDKIRKKYPDIPVFHTEEQATKAFPLTTPDQIPKNTPERKDA